MGSVDEVEKAVFVLFVLVQLSKTHRVRHDRILIGHEEERLLRVQVESGD